MNALKKSPCRLAIIACVLSSGVAVGESGVVLEGLREDQLREMSQERVREENRVNSRLQEQLKSDAGGDPGAVRNRNQYRHTERVGEPAYSRRSAGQGFGNAPGGRGNPGGGHGGGRR